jgi:hypothetical protein
MAITLSHVAKYSAEILATAPMVIPFGLSLGSNIIEYHAECRPVREIGKLTGRIFTILTLISSVPLLVISTAKFAVTFFMVCWTFGEIKPIVDLHEFVYKQLQQSIAFTVITIVYLSTMDSIRTGLTLYGHNKGTISTKATFDCIVGELDQSLDTFGWSAHEKERAIESVRTFMFYRKEGENSVDPDFEVSENGEDIPKVESPKISDPKTPEEVDKPKLLIEKPPSPENVPEGKPHTPPKEYKSPSPHKDEDGELLAPEQAKPIPAQVPKKIYWPFG